jgi:hypothetical protein
VVTGDRPNARKPLYQVNANGRNERKGGKMLRFFTHSVFPYLASAAIASMVALILFLAKREGEIYLLLLIIPAALIFLIYRGE